MHAVKNDTQVYYWERERERGQTSRQTKERQREKREWVSLKRQSEKTCLSKTNISTTTRKEKNK